MAGRPRKPHAIRRALPVTVRLTPDEAVRLDDLAAQAGLAVSEFIRSRLFATRPAPSISADMRHDVFRLMLDLQRGHRDGTPRAALDEQMQAVIDRLQP